MGRNPKYATEEERKAAKKASDKRHNEKKRKKIVSHTPAPPVDPIILQQIKMIALITDGDIKKFKVLRERLLSCCMATIAELDILIPEVVKCNDGIEISRHEFGAACNNIINALK